MVSEFFGISKTVFDFFSDRNRRYRYFSESESVIGIGIEIGTVLYRPYSLVMFWIGIYRNSWASLNSKS
jgi:hypothetical protein